MKPFLSTLRGLVGPHAPAAWRQRDLDYFTGDSFRQVLETRGIALITWREIAAKLKRAAR